MMRCTGMNNYFTHLYRTVQPIRYGSRLLSLEECSQRCPLLCTQLVNSSSLIVCKCVSRSCRDLSRICPGCAIGPVASSSASTTSSTCLISLSKPFRESYQLPTLLLLMRTSTSSNSSNQTSHRSIVSPTMLCFEAKPTGASLGSSRDALILFSSHTTL